MKKSMLTAIPGLLLAVGLMQAQPRAPRVDELKTYLGLSDTQVQSLVQIRQDERKQVQAIQDGLRGKRQALQDALRNNSNDAAAIGQLMIDLRDGRAKEEPIRQQAHDQALAGLTPDQKTKLEALVMDTSHRRELREAIGLGLVDRGQLRQAAPRSRNRSSRRGRV